MKMVIGIVRTTGQEHVVHALEHIGVKSMSISEIRGLGEEVRLENPYAIHTRIDVIVSDEKAGEVVRTILEHSRTGLAGDGIVSVQPLDYAVKIRNGEKLR